MQHQPAAQATSLQVETPLKNRNFRLLWIGEGISVLGDHLYLIALPWLVLQLTGSALALGTVMALASVPRALFMLVGGALVDRFSPRSIMFGSNFVRMVLVGLLTLLVVINAVQLWMLYLFALAFGVADAFYFPANSAILPRIVKTEQLQAGNALLQGTMMLSMFLGPVLAGVIIALINGSPENTESVSNMQGIALVFGLDALSFLASIGGLALMKLDTMAASKSEQGVFSAIKEGTRFMWKDTVLRTVFILLCAIYFLIVGPYSVGLPVLVEQNLGENAMAYGIIMSAQGAGMLLGMAIAAMLPKPKPSLFGSFMLWATALMGMEMALLPLTSSAVIVTLLSLVIGVTNGFISVNFITWLQKRVPSSLMGRVMSLVMFTAVGTEPISSALAGVILNINLTVLFVAAGGLLTVIALLATTFKGVRMMGLETPENTSTLADGLRATGELITVRTTGTLPAVKL